MLVFFRPVKGGKGVLRVLIKDYRPEHRLIGPPLLRILFTPLTQSAQCSVGSVSVRNLTSTLCDTRAIATSICHYTMVSTLREGYIPHIGRKSTISLASRKHLSASPSSSSNF